MPRSDKRRHRASPDRARVTRCGTLWALFRTTIDTVSTPVLIVTSLDIVLPGAQHSYEDPCSNWIRVDTPRTQGEPRTLHHLDKVNRQQPLPRRTCRISNVLRDAYRPLRRTGSQLNNPSPNTHPRLHTNERCRRSSPRNKEVRKPISALISPLADRTLPGGWQTFSASSKPCMITISNPGNHLSHRISAGSLSLLKECE